jgi:hypothetical protein
VVQGGSAVANHEFAPFSCALEHAAFNQPQRVQADHELCIRTQTIRALQKNDSESTRGSSKSRTYQSPMCHPHFLNDP